MQPYSILIAAVYFFRLTSNRTAQAVVKKKEPITAFCSACYRLCVCASGSLITVVFSCLTQIRVSFLHFGQNSGKFFSSVSARIFNLVLFPQTGQYIHSDLSIHTTSIAYLKNCPIKSVSFNLFCTSSLHFSCFSRLDNGVPKTSSICSRVKE